MFTFKDGSTLSFKEAAAEVREEGALIAYEMYNDVTGRRCVMGVIYNWTDLNGGTRQFRSGQNPYYPVLESKLVQENNNFRGTDEERCEHMAQYLEGLEE